MIEPRRPSGPSEVPVNRRLSSVVLGLAVLASPVWAANRDMERLQIQVATLQTQIGDLQKTAEDNLREIKRLNEQLAAQSVTLEKAMQDARAQDEALRATLKDVHDRLSELAAERTTAGSPTGPSFGAFPQGAGSPPAGEPGSPQPAPPSLPAPRELYSQAYADYARGNYDVAIQGFQEYLKDYPDTDFSDNAQYWIGECLYGKQKYGDAVEAWNTLLRDYPSSDKLPDARFKKGLALERLGRRSQALVEYRYVADRYPNSEAGRKARERLGPQ
jgi:tol-pal system protein YbgF